ncbi:hypothetical protein BJX70DRAFT_374266 [Aspergillus crustosus]
MALNANNTLFRRTASNFSLSIKPFTQKRSWSARTVPSFQSTKSPELDSILNRFRDELFIPKSLTTEQQFMIYRTRHAAKLTENPITVAVGEDNETYHLRPLDQRKLPSQRDSIEAFSLMHKTQDWSNLAIFLTGLHNSGRVVDLAHWEWLVRKSGSSNGLGSLLQCAQQAKDTKFSLRNPEIVRKLFFQLHLVTQKGGFEGPVVEKTYRLAKQFSHLMETEAHAVNDLKTDPKRSTFVIGTLLELSAADALNEPSTEKGAEVLKYALRFIASRELPSKLLEKGWSHPLNSLLQEAAANYNAINLALKVPEVIQAKDVATGLKKRLTEYGTFIKKAKELAPKDKATLGLQQAQSFYKD